GEILRAGLDPADVYDALRLCRAASFGQHGEVRIEPDYPLEQMSKAESEDARAATSIEEPSSPVEAELLGEHRLELGRVRRSARPVVGGGPCVDRGVVRHGENVASMRNGAWSAPFLVGGGGGSRSLSAS